MTPTKKSVSTLFWAVLRLVAQSCLTPCDHMPCSPPGSSVHGDSPDKITGVVSLSLLQGIFPTQELKVDSLPTELSGKPKTLVT